jgi:hypothetical protein
MNPGGFLNPNPNKPEITNHKHPAKKTADKQISNKFQTTSSKFQILNTKELNYFNFSSIDENIFFNSFGLLHDYKVWNFEFRSL